MALAAFLVGDGAHVEDVVFAPLEPSSEPKMNVQ